MNIASPRFWRMVAGIRRFYRHAPHQLDGMADAGASLGAFLRAQDYNAVFIRDHLLPMAAAIWSGDARDMLGYPAAAFLRFFQSHGLLQLRDRPQWRTVSGGSREYVRRLTAPFADSIRHTAAVAVSRQDNGVRVRDISGAEDMFDHVVLATHADEALRLLADPGAEEREALGCWRYRANHAVLHRDAGLMPKRRRVWSSWNFIGGQDADARLCVTYWMNRLQSLDPSDPLFVTLNPVRPPAPESVIARFDYTHPGFDQAALRSQHRLWTLQGRRNTWYCGSYFGYGFHEDALQSGLAVAEWLGQMQRPWSVDGENNRLAGFPGAGAPA